MAAGSFEVCLTHDVDRVRKTYQYASHALKGLLEGRIGRAAYHLASIFSGNPYWNFDCIMGIEEELGVRSTWFFLNETIPLRWLSPSRWTLSLGYYSFSQPEIQAVIRKLDAGGWEVGLHGSYESYRDLELLEREKRELEAVLGREVEGIRQHYLNLDIPDTWVLQKKAGFRYDSSFGLARDVGFRDERHQPFTDDESNMVILPLTIMDKYLFDLADGSKDAWNRCLAVIDEAENHRGHLNILWHQRVFNDREFPGYAAVYRRIIEECQSRGAAFRLCREVYGEFQTRQERP